MVKKKEWDMGRGKRRLGGWGGVCGTVPYGVNTFE